MQTFLPSPHFEKGQKGPTCKHFGRLRECWYGGPIARNVGPVDHFEEKWSNRANVQTFPECWHVGHITKMLGRCPVEQFYKATVPTFPRRIRAVRRANISRVSSKRATVQTFSRFRECWHVGLVRGKRRKCLHVGHCVADVPTFFRAPTCQHFTPQKCWTVGHACGGWWGALSVLATDGPTCQHFSDLATVPTFRPGARVGWPTCKHSQFRKKRTFSETVGTSGDSEMLARRRDCKNNIIRWHVGHIWPP